MSKQLDIFYNTKLLEDEDLYEFEIKNDESVDVYYAGWLLVEYSRYSTYSYMTDAFELSDYDFICRRIARLLNINIIVIKRTLKYN